MLAVALRFACFLLSFYFASPSSAVTTCSVSKFVSAIPSNHLYATKTKPLVLGHHGNPSRYQENTVDGFTSLLETNADGFEFDTFLTKDEKLVVIHYNNTKELTGTNHTIWDSTYEELESLDLPTNLTYGKNSFLFDKPRKIPLLSDVIKAMKGRGLVMYLNIKPGFIRNLTESAKVGRAVAKLVTDEGVVNEVLIASFDPFKILAAKDKNSALVVGMFYNKGMWKEKTANHMKKVMVGLPGMKDCVNKAPNGTNFMKFLFENGAMLKATNASFLLMDYDIFDNSKYSNNTFQVFRENYGSHFSFGAFVIDHLKFTEAKKKEDEKKIDKLLKNKVSCLATDDVPRLLKKLGRPTTPSKPSTSQASTITSPATPKAWSPVLVTSLLPLLPLKLLS